MVSWQKNLVKIIKNGYFMIKLLPFENFGIENL